MGQMFMYDHYLSRRAVSDFDAFTLDDVDAAFANSIQLRYSQPLALGGKGEGITITAYPAGHLLGGAVWKIVKDMDEIVYAVDYNHRKERHLSGTLLETLARPAVLITDAYSALAPVPDRKARDAELLERIMAALRAGGNVLLPVETAGRVLEVILHLEQQYRWHPTACQSRAFTLQPVLPSYLITSLPARSSAGQAADAAAGAPRPGWQGKHWAAQRLTYPLALLTHVAYNTLEFAKSSLEWMSEGIARLFESSRDNPFDTKYLKLCHTREELEVLGAGPKVVLASLASLEAGYSRQLFVEWASHPANLVLFTEHGQMGSLASLLQSQPPPKAVRLAVSRKVPLEGEELQLHEKEQQKAKSAALSALAAQSIVALDGGSIGAPVALGAVAIATPSEGRVAMEMEGDLALTEGVNVAGSSRTEDSKGTTASMQYREVLVEGFVPSPTSVTPIFPHSSRKATFDEYGEVIDPDDFVVKRDDDVDLFSAAKGLEAEGQADVLVEEAPSKVVTEDVTLQIRCQLAYLDFEGRSDGRSMKTIIAHVNPMKMVLVHGSAKAMEHLKEHCEQHVCPFVYAPHIGEWADVSSDQRAIKVQLTEALMSKVFFSKQLDSYEVVWVNGSVGPSQDGVLPLQAAPLELVPLHKPVLVGDLRLSEFKSLLQAQGFKPEFVDGVLQCAEDVVVRKFGEQQFALEGALSEDFYRVRELLYSQFYIL
eukprot:SM000049S16709  [mRNA]  locus=s49:243078:248533:+ [translate_table: standard]